MQLNRTPLAACLLVLAFASSPTEAGGQVRVISDRTPAHLEPLFAEYERGTGVEVQAVFVDDGLLARLAARPDEADLVITSTADILERAARDGLLRPVAADVATALRPEFRHPDDAYVILSYRARALYVSKDRVELGEIESYADLAAPGWKGRVCIRSGYHRYNVSLFAQMAATHGLEWTRAFLTGLRGNLARAPKGNDRNQVRGIHQGVCDVAVANSYYMGIMLGRDDQRAWGQSARVVFPDQSGPGAYVMTGGAALTRADRAVDEASRLLAFLLSDYGQTFIVNTTYEYAVIDGVEVAAANRVLGAEQADVVDGRFKANVVPLGRVDEMRARVIEILDRVDFDGG